MDAGKVIFFGTTDFSAAVLDTLVKEGYCVSAVVTQPDKPVGRKHVLEAPEVKKFALEHGIPVVQPERLTKEADSVLSLTAQDQTTDLQISGDSLEINMGTTVVSLSRTPAEAVSFPAPVAAESADAFNGIWIPCAQVTSGMYAKMSEESIAQYGKISIEDGKVSVLYDSGSGEYVTAVTYETTYGDGILTGEDSRVYSSQD